MRTKRFKVGDRVLCTRCDCPATDCEYRGHVFTVIEVRQDGWLQVVDADATEHALLPAAMMVIGRDPNYANH